MRAVLAWILVVVVCGCVGGGAASQPPAPDHQYYYDGYMADVNSEWLGLSARINHPKCIDIPANLTLCRNIGYTQMRLPNLLEHDSVREVTQQASSWVPLLNIVCHPDTQVFLCSLFSPVCLDRPIPPCRSLCEAVKQGCAGRMLKWGFPWPEILRCDKFPLENDLCIGVQSDNKPGKRIPPDGGERCKAHLMTYPPGM